MEKTAFDWRKIIIIIILILMGSPTDLGVLWAGGAVLPQAPHPTAAPLPLNPGVAPSRSAPPDSPRKVKPVPCYHLPSSNGFCLFYTQKQQGSVRSRTVPQGASWGTRSHHPKALPSPAHPHPPRGAATPRTPQHPSSLTSITSFSQRQLVPQKHPRSQLPAGSPSPRGTLGLGQPEKPPRELGVAPRAQRVPAGLDPAH